MGTLEVLRHRELLRHPADDGAVGGLRVFLVLVEEDLPCRVDEDGPEDRDHPVEGAHQRDAGEDEGAAQHDGAEDTPEEDAVLVPRRNGEAAEEKDENEQVIDGERLLQQVPGEVLEPLLPAVFEPDEETEADREHDPEHAPPDGFLERRGLVARGDSQVHGENDEDADQEGRPQQRAADVARPEVDGDVHRPALRDPRGVARLFCRKIRRTGTRSLNSSRKRLTRNRR